MNLFLIWSNEHAGWWGPNRCGYVKSDRKAGRYTLEEASQICINANRWLKDTDPPNECLVPVLNPVAPME